MLKTKPINENQQVLAAISNKFRNTWLTDSIYLSVALLIFYSLWLGHYPLFTPDEGRYAEAAREMIVTGDYITPHVNGIVFLDKPILYYWLQTIAMHLFGVNEWAIRFFPMLFGVFGCLVTYVTGRRLFDRTTGLLSAVILASSPLYFAGAHYANLDLEIAVLISCTLLFFLVSIQSTDKWRRPCLIASYVFSALGFLTKGLIAIAFPVLIAGSWILITNQWRCLKKIYLPLGLIIFIILVTPWYVLVQKANPEFLHYFFVTQQVTRFLSKAEFNNQSPIWFYVPVLLIGFLPWSLFCLAGLNKQVRATWKSPKTHSTTLYLLLWVTIILVFFSIPHSKIVTYILPVIPALALLTGSFVATLWHGNKRLRFLFTLAAIASAVFLLTVTFNAQHLNNRSAKSLTKILQTRLQPQDEVVNYFKFYQDVPVYLGRKVVIVADWNAPDIAERDNWMREIWFSLPFQNPKDILIDEKAFWRDWESSKHIYVFLNENYLQQFKSRAKKYFYVGHSGDIILLTNHFQRF